MFSAITNVTDGQLSMTRSWHLHRRSRETKKSKLLAFRLGIHSRIQMSARIVLLKVRFNVSELCHSPSKCRRICESIRWLH